MENETVDTVDKFTRLAAVLEQEHVERTEEIHCAMLALVAGCTFFLLGEPGIAKSMLPRRIRAYIDGGRYFDHDMDRFSTPEDLFGPRSLSAMQDDRWERNIEGTIVTADWCFLDEFFEASSALLKTLLRALNEGEYHQGTEIIPMNLTTVFCASNEIPGEPRLMPLYDRLLLRRQVRSIRDPHGFTKMLGLTRDPKPEPLLTWDEVMEAQELARTVVIPTSLFDNMLEIRTTLATEHDIRPSDRRFYDALRVVRAEAWLENCQTAEAEHLRCLADILWTHPDQIAKVTAVVDSVLEPLVSEVDELLRAIRALDRQIVPDLERSMRESLANQLYDRTKEAEAQLKEIEGRSSGSRRQTRKLDSARKALGAVSLRILAELFQVSPDEVAQARRSQ